MGEDPCRNGLEKDVFGKWSFRDLFLRSVFENTPLGPPWTAWSLYLTAYCLVWRAPGAILPLLPRVIFGELPLVCMLLGKYLCRQEYLHDQVMLI